MNRASEIEASMANIQYELENDIYNPPVLKDNKPFNMSDYIKPVRVTDTDDYIEKDATTIDENQDDDISELTEEILNSCFDSIQEEGFEQLASHDDKDKQTNSKYEKMYTDKLIDKNIDNLKENVLESKDKVDGLKKATKRFVDDNKGIIDNVPEVTKDVGCKTVSWVSPFANTDKKIANLRRMVEYEINKRNRQKQEKMKKQATLLGEYFFK